VRKAEQMLNESVLHTCHTSGCMIGNTQFRVVGMQRLENYELFRKFISYETRTATEVPVLCPNTKPAVHPWLASLAKKNKLSTAANTHITYCTGHLARTSYRLVVTDCRRDMRIVPG
jgi:hypothetical protein